MTFRPTFRPSFRPLAFALALMSISMAVPSCATVPPGTPPTPATNLEACSDAAVDAGAKAILGEIMSALSTGNYVAALADLAARFGGPEVVCGVNYVVQEIQSKLAASPPGAVDPVLASEAARGQAYLKSHPTADAGVPVSLLRREASHLSYAYAGETVSAASARCISACAGKPSIGSPGSACSCWWAKLKTAHGVGTWLPARDLPGAGMVAAR